MENTLVKVSESQVVGLSLLVRVVLIRGLLCRYNLCGSHTLYVYSNGYGDIEYTWNDALNLLVLAPV
jgi:hypothetical protein